MPITTNRYKVTPLQQMVDLNGDAKNFKLKFTCKAENDSTPFEVLVLTQAQLDNPNSKNLNYKKVNGQITGEILADKNVYQNYFLLIKSEEECMVEIVSNFEKLDDYIPPKQPPSQHRQQSNRPRQHHQHQHQHQHQPRQHSHQDKKSKIQAPKNSLDPNPKTKDGFFNSQKFLWVVVGIVSIFLIYFIFFYKKGNTDQHNLIPMNPTLFNTSPSLISTKIRKKKKKHNSKFDDF